MTKPLQELREERHTSVSALKTYLQCPRKYSLHYIQQVEPAFRPAALAFGTAFHEAIGEYLRASRPEHVVSVERLHEVFCRSFQAQLKQGGVPVVFDEEETAAQHVELAAKMLRAFVEQIELPKRVRGIEVPFRLDIDDPETGEVLPALIGAIDVVVEAERGTEAWELKTTARRWANDPLGACRTIAWAGCAGSSEKFRDRREVLPRCVQLASSGSTEAPIAPLWQGAASQVTSLPAAMPGRGVLLPERA